MWHGLLREVEMRHVGGVRGDIAQTHGMFLAAVMKLRKKKNEPEVGDIKRLALTVVSYLLLVPDLNAKGAKFTFLTQVLFPFIGKKTEQWGAGAGEKSCEPLSACASVEFVPVAAKWRVHTPKKLWSWAEICSMFPRCLCHCRKGTG